jgi:hypothetical protein
MLQLMVDRTNSQIALQTFESRFDLRQLHVPVPQRVYKDLCKRSLHLIKENVWKSTKKFWTN